VGFADVILLNKTDLVSEEELQRIEDKIRSINAAARLYRTERANINLDHVLGVGGFDLDRILHEEPDFLGEAHDHDHDHDHEHEHDHDHKYRHHHHDEEVTSVGITIPGDLDFKKLNNWFSELLQTHGPDIFRMKGILSIKDEPRR